MPMVILTKRGGSPKEAKGVAGDARAVAAKYPASYAVQLELAEAELDAENLNAADRASDAALALSPDSPEALTFKGQVALARGKNDPKQYEVARSWFAKAYDADSDRPGPLLGNYLSYSKAGGTVPESAVIALEHAYRLAPHNDDLRIVLARQELVEKRLDVAKMLLVPLALSPHESKRAQAMNDVVVQIDAANRDAAIAKLDGWTKKVEEDKKKGG
jgi:tetratricopeptide (TPR) repeat protein